MKFDKTEYLTNLKESDLFELLKKIIPDLSENCLFFCGKELVYSSVNDKFDVKLVLLGFALEEPAESFDGFSPIYNGHIHIKNDYYRE